MISPKDLNEVKFNSCAQSYVGNGGGIMGWKGQTNIFSKDTCHWWKKWFVIVATQPSPSLKKGIEGIKGVNIEEFVSIFKPLHVGMVGG